jgi:hypothetical protein
MTYLELLRKIASLSDEQLKREVTLRSFTPKEITHYSIDRFCIWEDDITEEGTGEVEIQLSIDKVR